MFRTVLCCVLLAAPAAMAWQGLDESPIEVSAGAHLTWGNGFVWGMFPVVGASKTYVAICDPFAEEDSMWDDSTITPMSSSHRLRPAGCTFQWIEQPVFWGFGRHVDADTWSKLYWYVVDSAVWHQDTIDTFTFHDGASIAYQPNPNYARQLYPVPGCIYCLAGGGTAFWRYTLPTMLGPMTLDGIYPGQGAVIADQTPPFQWEGVGGSQYRIQVSTDQYFSSNVIDEIVSGPEYEPTDNLANGTYYWRTATWIGGAWSWGTSIHSFSLQGGWQLLASIPEAVTDGGIIAYDEGSFSGGGGSILALPGGGPNGNHRLHAYRYVISQNAWVQLDSVYATTVTEGDGTSLTTSAPVEGASALILAAFHNQTTGDRPYRYDGDDGWLPAENESDEDSLDTHFPENVGDYNSMVIGAGKRMYQIFDDEDFYFVHYPQDVGGNQQASVSKIGAAKAHVIAGHHAVEAEYQLPAVARVRATLHDAAGRQVGHLDAGVQNAGTHRLIWDQDDRGRRLSAGAYLVLLDMGTERATLKAVVK